MLGSPFDLEQEVAAIAARRARETRPAEPATAHAFCDVMSDTRQRTTKECKMPRTTHWNGLSLFA